MPFVTATLNAMLDALSPDTVSLHTGDPGSDGSANEVAGGTPPYARKAIAFAAAAGGSRDSTNQPIFDVPPSTTLTHVGFWAGATFLGFKALTQSETFNLQGTYELTDADLTLTSP